ncbi:TylF/MycF/NovP-related O-methyltransferase [uncultured Imperialibacter sp.]|uniref:TylF/MycF/NovP-related O-methyltransferase n=1 Tax=uncultured Imperialibacter sp. TaxID=1672639 RepID=UPI0030D6F80F
MFNTPVLYLIFNRPDLVRVTFEKIREVKPRQLFVGADGPRITHPDDNRKCEECRELVLSLVDWECEIHTLFRDSNLGCGKAVSEAITWFFDQVEMGIVLEDDCVPHKSFFTFCEELLLHFKDDDSVMHISGNNFQNGRQRGDGSYYFSKYSHSWGWATWSNAWRNFEKEIDLAWLKKHLQGHFSRDERKYWNQVAEGLLTKRYDAWDYQWMFSIWKNLGVCILPNTNLVNNIGFGRDATHTKQVGGLGDLNESRGIDQMIFLSGEKDINTQADEFTFSNHFHQSPNMTKQLKQTLFPYLGWVKRLYRKSVFIRYFGQFKEFSMIPKEFYLANLELCYSVGSTKGDVVECGTWKGGMIAGIGKVLGNSRKYHLFDSFEGLPNAKSIDGESALKWQKDTDGDTYFDNCYAKREDAEMAMNKASLTNYTIYKGWFNDTLSNFPATQSIAILRLDGDWYDSTITCLRAFFPKVNPGGIVIIDDYNTWDGCSKAVHDYLSETKSNARINVYKGVFYLIKR